MFMSFSKNKFMLLWQNSVTDFSVGFRPPTLGTRGFLACGGDSWCWPKADTSSAVGRSREKTLWHGAVLFTVPVDLCAFLSDYICANQIESLRL